MNAYTTTGQARIQSRDLAAILQRSTGSYMTAASLAALERQRGYHVEAEVEWLLTHNGVTPQVRSSVFSLRQRIGAALVRAGERLAGDPLSAVSPEMTSATNKLGEAS